jgi:ribokinase
MDPTFPAGVDKALLPFVTAITPNQHEAEVLLGDTIRDDRDAEEAARLLRSLGPTTACLKLSDGGCVFADMNGVKLIPAIPVDVVDKTGAGDAFIGAMAAGLAEGRSIEGATLWGGAGSSFVVGRRDAQASYPTRAEFFHFLEQR